MHFNKLNSVVLNKDATKFALLNFQLLHENIYRNSSRSSFTEYVTICEVPKSETGVVDYV